MKMPIKGQTIGNLIKRCYLITETSQFNLLVFFTIRHKGLSIHSLYDSIIV